MTKTEFIELADKKEQTEEDKAKIEAHAKEFRDRFLALTDEYGLDFSARSILEIVLKK